MRKLVILSAVGLLLVSLGFLIGSYQNQPPKTDIEDEGTLCLAQETFQGYPYFYIEGTDWVLQITYDGKLLQCHDYMRWTDGNLRKITGYSR